MKSLLKFALLSAIIISGKLAKNEAQVPASQALEVKARPDTTSMVLVHQVLTSEPVKPTRQQNDSEQSGNGLLAEMF